MGACMFHIWLAQSVLGNARQRLLRKGKHMPRTFTSPDQPFSQSDLSKTTNHDIGNGVCAQLCKDWLRSPDEFWKNVDKANKNDEKSSLLGRLHDNIIDQAEYISSKKFDPLDLTANFYVDFSKDHSLSRKNLTSLPFYIQPQARIIAESVFTTGANYFFFGAIGIKESHMMAFYRKYKLIGISSTIFFFDPNYGEFTLNGPGEVEELLMSMQAPYYDLGDQWVLVAYK